MQAPLLPAVCARQGRTELDQVGTIAGQTWGASDWKAAELTRRCRAFRPRHYRRVQPLSSWDILDELRWAVAGAVC